MVASAQKNRLVPISEEVWRTLVKLSESLPTQSPPVDLEWFAKDVAIQHVRFKPLISDAGLAKRGDSLEIWVNTEAPGIRLPAETTASVGDGTWGKFQRSLRFTVAHEIAHAAFMRAAKQRDEDDLLGRHRSDIEEACKILARLMLLPRHVLSREITERLLDVEHLKRLTEAFQVSPEVFLRRFHLSDLNRDQEKLDGFIAFVQERERRLRIKAAHVFGRYATDRFHRALQQIKPGGRQMKFKFPGLSGTYRQVAWALEGMAVNEVRLDEKKDIESIMRTTGQNQLDLEVGWSESEVIPCNLFFLRIHQKPLGFLVRAQVVGPVQKPGQKSLF